MELIEAYLEYKKFNENRSDRTIEVYRLALSRLMTYFGDRDPLQANNDDLVAFCGPWLHKQGLQDPTSRRTHVAAVRGFYKWLHRTRRIKHDPSDVPYPQRSRRIPDTITLANAEKLMWAPDFATFEGVRDGAILSLLAGCGLRVSGLTALNDDNLATVELNDEPRMIIKVREKGDKERLIPIPKEADLILRLYLEHPDLKEINRDLPDGRKVLFVSTMNRRVSPDKYHGEARRLTRNAVLKMIKKYGDIAGIPEEQLHPHAMRHLFGTELAEDQVDLIARQRLMGHEDPKSTAIYDHMAMRKLTREADRANPLAKMKTPVSDLIKRLKGSNG